MIRGQPPFFSHLVSQQPPLRSGQTAVGTLFQTEYPPPPREVVLDSPSAYIYSTKRYILISRPFSHPTTAYLHPLTKTDQTAAQNENQWRTTGRAGQEAVQVVSSGARPSFICGRQCLPPTRGHYRPVLGAGRPARDPAPTGTMCAVCRDPRAGWVAPISPAAPWRRARKSPGGDHYSVLYVLRPSDRSSCGRIPMRSEYNQ